MLHEVLNSWPLWMFLTVTVGLLELWAIARAK